MESGTPEPRPPLARTWSRRRPGGGGPGTPGPPPATRADLVEQSPRYRARQRGFAVRDAAEETDDPLRRLALQQIAGSAAADRPEQVVLGSRRREHDDLAARSGLA